jgi:hypothetical protein
LRRWAAKNCWRPGAELCAGDQGDTRVMGSDEEDWEAAPRCSWAARKRIERSCACWRSWRLGIEGTKGLRVATTWGGGEAAPRCGSHEEHWRPGEGEKQRQCGDSFSVLPLGEGSWRPEREVESPAEVEGDQNLRRVILNLGRYRF